MKFRSVLVFLLLSRNSRNGLVCPIEPIQLIVLTSMQPVGQSSIA